MLNLKITSFTLTAAILLIGCILLTNADVSHLPLANSAAPQQPPVTEVCLGCICEAISGCNQTVGCNGDVCGLFLITWPYWADSGKPTLEGEPATAQTAFANCVKDPYCAARTVQGYMTKFGQDCNGDGVINCYDHGAIHKLGGYGCTGALNQEYATKLDQCLKHVQQLQG